MKRLGVLVMIFVFMASVGTCFAAHGSQRHDNMLNRADRLNAKAAKFDNVNPAKANQLRIEARYLENKANQMQPIGVGVNNYNKTWNQAGALVNKAVINMPDHPKRADMLLDRVDNKIAKADRIYNNNMKHVNNMYTDMTDKANSLTNKANSIVSSNPVRAQKLYNKAAEIQSQADWVLSGTQSGYGLTQ